MPAAAATSAPATSVAKDKPKESPHVLTVPAADIETGSPETYTVTADGHSHQVVVDGPAMAKLKASRFALVRSELGGPNPHRHWVSVYAG